MLRGLQGLLLAMPKLSQALVEIDFKISTVAPLTIENSRTISMILRLSAMLFSAKMFFPIVILWKILKSTVINAVTSITTIIKNLTKLVYNIIKDIFNKFLTRGVVL